MVPGIGPARRKALLTHFRSIQAIQEASIDELQAVPGITTRLAEAIKEHLE
jgi:excinuclease ABC subunit C